MTTSRLSRLTAGAVLLLGLAGCVAYEPAPYYAPAPAYYGPTPGPSLSFEFRGGDRGERHEHWH
jgi:hypothetical protein